MRAFSIILVCALGLALAVAGRTESKVSRIDREISTVDDGRVLLTFAARPGVWGSGDQIHLSRNDRRVRGCGIRVSSHVTVGACYHGGVDPDEWEPEAEPPPVRVALTVKDGMVVTLKTRLGGHWIDGLDEATDLGIVSGAEAAGFLLSLAREARSEVAGDGILAACLAESADVCGGLLEIANTRSVPLKTKESALFWCGHVGDGKIAPGLDAIASDGTMERSLRREAISALSMCPAEACVPILMRIAATDPDVTLREAAIYGLSRHDDPRALTLLEELVNS